MSSAVTERHYRHCLRHWRFGMTPRGRPPATRARVLHYIEAHQPATIMQVVRATGADRAHIYRMLWSIYGRNFRSEGPWGAKRVADGEQLPDAA